MAQLVLVFVLGSAPGLLLLWYFRSRDRRPEPGRVIWATFGLGVLITIPIVLIAGPIDQLLSGIGDPYAKGLLQSLFAAALPEELFKYIVVVYFAAAHREFDEPMDGLVYGAVASLGFATLENLLYVGGHGSGVGIARAFTAVPSHALMGAVMGYYVGQGRFGPADQLIANRLRAYFYPVLLHAAYDFPILSLNADRNHPGVAKWMGLSLVVLIAEWIWVRRLVRRLRAAQLLDAAAPEGLLGGAPLPSSPLLPPQPVPEVAPPGPGSRAAVGWLLVLLALPLTLWGAFFSLIGVAMAFGQVPTEERGVTLVTAFVLGILPLAGGILAFRGGLRRLRSSGAAPR